MDTFSNLFFLYCLAFYYIASDAAEMLLIANLA